MNPFKKTKILATLGPATSSEEIITKLIQNGMNGARLNFSHGTHEDHKKNIERIRIVEKKFQFPTTIVQDLHGPKIALGLLTQESLMLIKNQSIMLFYGKEQQEENCIPVPFNIFPSLTKGNHVLINDGLIKLRVEKTTDTRAECVVLNGGEVRSYKGVNLPDTQLPNISITSRDKEDIVFGIQQKVDYIAVSFVQDENDIQTVRNIIDKHQHQPKIIAKIETAAAVKNLQNIIIKSDGVMVARGDLAAELGQEEVPIIQRRIIKLAKLHNKPVIVATQMLESMIHNAAPTRAEVSDVANAVFDEVDSVMLSAETAIGSFPVETVSMMERIIKRVEKYYEEKQKEFSLKAIEDYGDQTTAIAAAACILANQLQATMILSLTASGKTAIRLSSYRPFVPICTVTDDQSVYKQLALVWGILPFFKEKISSNAAAYAEVIAELEKMQQIKKGDKIVLVTGTHPGKAGHTNIISVTRVGEEN